MNTFVHNVYQKLLNDLNAIAELSKVGVKSPLQVAEKVRGSIKEIKSHFHEHPFADREQEIIFFKYEKPAIISEYIYAQELYAIESGKPAGDRHAAENYYTKELAFIRRFFDQYRFLYQYFQLDGTEFDELYFFRGGRQVEITLPVSPDADPEFSAPGDFLYAKFLAYERLQDWLINRLYGPDSASKPGNAREVRWTGDVINLVELIYGLYLTGQFNYGNASLNEIVRWAEEQFGVKIGVIQRRFAEIQNRKRIGPTKYIDQMRDSLLQKIEEMSA